VRVPEHRPPNTEHPPSGFAEGALRKWEVALLAALIVVGAWFRLSGLKEQGIRMVDEGTYCQFGMAMLRGERDVVFYKPGHAALVCLSFKLLGPAPSSPLIVSAWLGILTVPAMFLLARAMFDTVAGLVAAAVVSTMPFLLYYNRSALADGNYVFLDVLGLWLLWLAWSRERLIAALVLGVTSGAAFGLGFSMKPLAALVPAVAALGLGLWAPLKRARGARLGLLLAVVLVGALIANGLVELWLGKALNREASRAIMTRYGERALILSPNVRWVDFLVQFTGTPVWFLVAAGFNWARHARSQAHYLAIALLAGLAAIFAAVDFALPRMYVSLVVPATLLAGAGGSWMLAWAQGKLPERGRTVWTAASLVCLCALLVAWHGWQARDVLSLRSGYEPACRILAADGLTKGLTTHSWWTFQAFTGRRFTYMSDALAGLLAHPDWQTRLARNFRAMDEQGFSHLVIDYLFWNRADGLVTDRFREVLKLHAPAFVVPNPVAGHAQTVAEDGGLGHIQNEPLARSIYIFRISELARVADERKGT